MSNTENENLELPKVSFDSADSSSSSDSKDGSQKVDFLSLKFKEMMEDPKYRYPMLVVIGVFVLWFLAESMFPEPKQRVGTDVNEVFESELLSDQGYKNMTMDKVVARMKEMESTISKLQREKNEDAQESSKASEKLQKDFHALKKEHEDLKRGQKEEKQFHEQKLKQLTQAAETAKTQTQKMEKALEEFKRKGFVSGQNNIVNTPKVAGQNQAAQAIAPMLPESSRNPFAFVKEPKNDTQKTASEGQKGQVKPKYQVMEYDGDNTKSPEEKAKQAALKGAEKALEEERKKEEREKNRIFLPAGSIISGTLLNGLDAPTTGNARNTPHPMLMRVKSEAILPNNFSMDIKECFLIGAGYGELSSERVYSRLEKISCISEEGYAWEGAIDGYATGRDGKTGVAGRVVHKNGQLLGRTLMAGFMSGISKAMEPTQIQGLQTSPTSEQLFQTPDAQGVLTAGVFSGASTAMEKLADYYIDMAKNIFPVIEINAGVELDYIVKSGVTLDFNDEGGA